MSFTSVLVFGFLLGLRHAFEADHLVAVSTLVTPKRSLWKNIRFGVTWGLGHSATLLAVGGVVLILQVSIPPFLELSLEGLVGVMLVGLGLMTLLDCRRRRIHLHQHTHGGNTHLHFHAHVEGPEHFHQHGGETGWRPLLIGMVHGLAGSAAVLLLTVATAPSPVESLLYIGSFGCGSILGMGAASLLLGVLFSLMQRHLQGANLSLRIAAGATSVALGIWIIYELSLSHAHALV